MSLMNRRQWAVLPLFLAVSAGAAYGLYPASPASPASPVSEAKRIAAAPQQQNVTAARHLPLQEMSPTDIDAFLKELPAGLTQRIEKVSAQASGTPYFLGPLGEGPDAPYDKKPLIDLKRVDCVTFCEQTLALSLSQNYDEAVKVLQKIRYKAGEIKMECRNHYTMADWTVNNRWLMKDITPELAGHQWLTRTISHQNLFAAQKFAGIQVREPDRLMKVAYIPETEIAAILPQLKSGDMGVLIQDQAGIFAAHTGFMIQKGGQWVFRNATSIGLKQVVDTPMDEMITALKNSKRLIGMAFVRPRPEALQKVVL
jgi:hypothetical protein